jgi:hypothetical protein
VVVDRNNALLDEWAKVVSGMGLRSWEALEEESVKCGVWRVKCAESVGLFHRRIGRGGRAERERCQVKLLDSSVRTC